MELWIWLNEAQHSAAVQALASAAVAVCAVMLSIAAIFQCICAVRVYVAAKAQAAELAEQTAIARSEARSAEEHRRLERNEFAREGAFRVAQEEARIQRLRAEEDSGRPLWEVEVFEYMYATDFRVTNIGDTRALRVRFEDTGEGLVETRDTILQGKCLHVKYPYDRTLPRDFLLTFDTIFGSHWVMRFRQDKRGNWLQEVVRERRFYDPSTVSPLSGNAVDA